MRTIFILFGFLVLLTLNEAGAQSISCYECSHCRKELEYLPIKNMCKVCGKITTYEKNDVMDVTRRCLDSCDHMYPGPGQKLDCCYTDLCNSSLFLKASAFIASFAVLLLSVFSC